MSNKSENDLLICANCGKGEESSGSLKTCTACKLVKYCNRECQIAHRPQHKKACKQRAAELHDEKLFKQPPPDDDCPICMVRLPLISTARIYMACCGKILCCGCIYAPVRDDEGNVIREKTCPFCRASYSNSDEEMMKWYDKRIELNDPRAIYNLGCHYSDGGLNLPRVPRDHVKALELFHRAAELGDTNAYYSIGIAYKFGEGVEVDEKKAVHYWELAAMKGDEDARHNLGAKEANAGNADKALKHWMIAAKDGSARSLENIKILYMDGHTTKDDYTKALRSFQEFLHEIKSDQRDEAAAAYDQYKYYESAY